MYDISMEIEMRTFYPHGLDKKFDIKFSEDHSVLVTNKVKF